MTTPVGYGPLWVIDGPQPQKPRYTLVDSCRVVDDLDGKGIERWINGAEVYPFPPLKDQATGDAASGAWDACARGSIPLVDKAAGGLLAIPQVGAMVIYLAETCTTSRITGSGMSDDQVQARFYQRAVQSYSAIESALLETEFMSGAKMPLNPFLADGNGTFPWGDVATSIVNGFARLEGEIAKSGKAGMIHCSPIAATFAQANRLVIPDDRNNVLRTINGTIVVNGAGYAAGATKPGVTVAHPSAHTSASGTEEWIYATGLVEVRRSDIVQVPDLFYQALDRSTNTVTYRAERYYLVDWDGEVQAAVLVDLCSGSCGTPPS
jgi:hypothetical protein